MVKSSFLKFVIAILLLTSTGITAIGLSNRFTASYVNTVGIFDGMYNTILSPLNNIVNFFGFSSSHYVDTFTYVRTSSDIDSPPVFIRDGVQIDGSYNYRKSYYAILVPFQRSQLHKDIPLPSDQMYLDGLCYILFDKSGNYTASCFYIESENGGVISSLPYVFYDPDLSNSYYSPYTNICQIILLIGTVNNTSYYYDPCYKVRSEIQGIDIILDYLLVQKKV